MRRKVTLEEMRELQLDMLKKVHQFCVERGLRYSLGGGTLLGAVRHKGYIPWDDDVDIMMPRPDYERFIKEFEGQYENIAVQHYKNDESYNRTFAKVYDNRTVLIEEFFTNGVYIDVFPIDGLPKKEQQLSKHLKKINRYSYILLVISPKFRTSKIYDSVRSNSVSFLKCQIWKLLYRNRKNLIARIENHLAKYNFEDSSLVGAITGIYGQKEVMDSIVFKEYVLLPFEGYELFCIKNHDSYLTKHYGDYMQLPPIENRVSHHNYEVYWKDLK